VRATFGDTVPVIDGGPCTVGLESTVVAITSGNDGDQLTLLRPGMLTLDALTAATPDGAHPAPGMHHRHYSPRTPLLLIDHPSQLPGPTGAYLWRTLPGFTARLIQMPNEPKAYAARLYATLHDLDHAKLPWIAVETPPATPAWAAILDRLQRAQSR
jgi:L-threonylcarbamoyladenylate synthase